MNKHKSNKIKENSQYSEALDNGTDHNHSKSCCDQSSPARRTMRWGTVGIGQWRGDLWKGGPMRWGPVRLGTNEMGDQWVPIMYWGANELGDQWEGDQWDGGSMRGGPVSGYRLLLLVWTSCWTTNRVGGDLRHIGAHVTSLQWSTDNYL